MRRLLRVLMGRRRACPCCGYLTLGWDHPYATCEVCYWEDDPDQEEDPNLKGAGLGNPRVSLNEARENLQRFGASDIEFREYVRAPTREEVPNERR